MFEDTLCVATNLYFVEAVELQDQGQSAKRLFVRAATRQFTESLMDFRKPVQTDKRAEWDFR